MLEVGILARTNLPFEQLRGPLVIGDLAADIGEVERSPFELFKLGAQLLVLVVEPLRQWDLVGSASDFSFSFAAE